MSVDWFRVISDLQRSGLTYKQQAKEVGINSAGTIYYWKCGNQPPHDKGEKLLDVYRSVMGSTA